MKTMLTLLFLSAVALAQPPGPPGPPPGNPPKTAPAGNPPKTAPAGNTQGGAANLSLPHVVGTLSGFSATRFTVKREMGAGGPTANMDFRVAPGAFLGPGLKSGTRAVVVYRMNPQGEGYQALGAVALPQGSDPKAAIQGMPRLK